MNAGSAQSGQRFPSLIVHGGAWTIPSEAAGECREGCERALDAGWKILAKGGPALDAVEAAIMVLEDAAIFDAGFGSHLNRDGHVQLDAIVMDGRNLAAGAVAAIERVKNPIRLARRVMEIGEHVFLVGAGAEQFAVEQGFSLCTQKELICERERKKWEGAGVGGVASGRENAGEQLGTVGAVAMDEHGGLIAGTSTGGTFRKYPGRVGDSPLIGCGCYADVEAGGISCTGHGEAIMRVVLAKVVAESLRAGGEAMVAAEAGIKLLGERVQGIGGLILLDRNGRPGFAFNTPNMAFGFRLASGEVRVSA